MKIRRRVVMATIVTTCLLPSAIFLQTALGQDAPAAPAAAPAAAPVTPIQPQDHVVTGTQVLNAADLTAISNLTVQSGSTLILDFGAGGGNGTVPGTISNSGTIYAVSSLPSVTTANINANQFSNQANAVFTSVLPQGGLSGFANLATNFGLNFNVNSFVNNGLVASAGNLNVTAVNNFVNAGTMTSAGSITALASSAAIINTGVMQAVQNINLTSGIGSIINSGTITATMGNININSLIQNNILNNVSGLLQASNGSINIGSAQSALQNISINGGDLIAKEINLIAPGGEISAMLGSVNGTLSTTADVVHLGSSTGNLTLGEITCTGDPTYFNDLGDITITGNITVGETLAILASGNITIDPTVSITAQDIGGQGYPIYIVAGATLFSAAAAVNTLTGAPPVGNAASNVAVGGPGTFGGNIIFSGNNTISSSSTCAGCAGGNTTLVAYTGQIGSGNGRIDMVDASNSIDASGGSGGNNGDITLIAGGAQGGGSLASITVGTLTSTGGNASTGTININAMPPIASNGAGAAIIFGTNGSITSGNTFSFLLNFLNPTNIITTGAITAPNVNALAGASFVANASIGGETIALTVFNPTTSTFTNNSTIVATDGNLYISSTNIQNNGLLMSTSLSNPTQVSFFTNGTDLTITQGLGASIQSNSPNAFGLIELTTTAAGIISINGGDLIANELDTSGTDGYSVNITANSINTEVDTLGNPFGGVQVTALTGDLNICGCIDTSNVNGNGGNITLRAMTGSITALGDFVTNGFGAGNRAGNVFIQAGQNLQQFGSISARGIQNADGGNVTISTPQGTAEIQNFGGPAISTGSDILAGNGGNVSLVANTLAIAGDFISIDTSAFAGAAGNVTLTQLSSTPFVIGGCGCTNIGGDIMAVGFESGGKIALQSGGSFEIQPGVAVAAVGVLQAGSIAFSSTAPTLNVQNDGFLFAATIAPDSNSGVVGFQSFGNPINLTGSGLIAAGQFVAFGNLDPVTLTPFNATILPSTDAFTYGNISAIQGSPMIFRIAVSNPPTRESVPTPVTPVATTVPIAFPSLGPLPTPLNPIILQTDQQSQLFDSANGDQQQALQGLIRQTDDAALSNGQLIIATEDGVIKTPFGDLYVKTGAVVYLIQTEDGATVYNLHDDHEDSVNLVVDGKKIPIPIGAFAMSTHSDANFESLNPAKVLATRRVTDSKLENGQHIHSGEFSLMSALLNIPPLFELRKSDAPNERKVIAQIMQDAAILMTLTARNGAYTASSEQ